MECKFCQSKSVVKSGTKDNLQRYQCKRCKKFWFKKIQSKSTVHVLKSKNQHLQASNTRKKNVVQETVSRILKWLKSLFS